MIVEIRQAGFVNKGAELMLHAIVQKLRSRYPDAKLVMAPVFGGAVDTYDKMRALSLYPKAGFWHRGIDFGAFAKWVPKGLLRVHGMVTDDEVDVVLDAAGFSYSDQWGPSSSVELARASRKWRAKGTKLIMLPQALGPFEGRSIRRHAKRWAENADLIFAREQDSYRYLTDLVGIQEKIALSADFTNLVAGVVPPGFPSADKQIAIVPNYRMIDKTNPQESQAYLPFLRFCAQYLAENGGKPFLLIHEGLDDEALAQEVSRAAGGIPIVKEADPLRIKGILGSCTGSVGSRFHGLVSALSQGVPSFATGWSHKYQRLFADYGFEEGVLSVLDEEAALREKLDRLLDPEASEDLRASLAQRAGVLKTQSEDMWRRVFTCMDEVRPR